MLYLKYRTPRYKKCRKCLLHTLFSFSIPNTSFYLFLLPEAGQKKCQKATKTLGNRGAQTRIKAHGWQLNEGDSGYCLNLEFHWGWTLAGVNFASLSGFQRVKEELKSFVEASPSAEDGKFEKRKIREISSWCFPGSISQGSLVPKRKDFLPPFLDYYHLLNEQITENNSSNRYSIQSRENKQ